MRYDERLQRVLRSLWLPPFALVLVSAAVAIAAAQGTAHPNSAKVGQIETTSSPAMTVAISATGTSVVDATSGPGTSQAGLESAYPIFVSGTSPSGLIPGMPSPITVTVANPNGQSVLVTSVVISVGDATPNCPAAGAVVSTNYEATTPGAQTYVALPGGLVQVPLTITLLDTVATRGPCKEAHWPLTFAVAGRHA